MAKSIAYACLAISATLAGLYGYMTAGTVLYGAIRAASLCAVAIVGPCCPAWASHHWNDGRYGVPYLFAYFTFDRIHDPGALCNAAIVSPQYARTDILVSLGLIATVDEVIG